MKNNHGQVLISFLLFLPLILIGISVFIDSSYILYQKNRLDNINDDVINSFQNQDLIEKTEIEKILLLNEKEIIIDNIVIDDGIEISDHMMIKSLFGKLIGIDQYKVSSNKKYAKFEKIGG